MDHQRRRQGAVAAPGFDPPGWGRVRRPAMVDPTPEDGEAGRGGFWFPAVGVVPGPGVCAMQPWHLISTAGQWANTSADAHRLHEPEWCEKYEAVQQTFRSGAGSIGA